MTARAWLARRLRWQRTELRGHRVEIRGLRAEVNRLHKKVIPELWETLAKPSKQDLDNLTRDKRRAAFLRRQLAEHGVVESAISKATEAIKEDGTGGLGISTATAYRALAFMYEEDRLRVDPDEAIRTAEEEAIRRAEEAEAKKRER
jgi:hypothetical protein